MIQRIQSLWLIITSAIAAFIWFTPIYTGIAADGIEKTYTISESLPLMLIVALSILVPLVTIFLFKKRDLQKKFILLQIVFALGIHLFEYFNAEKFKTDFTIQQGHWHIGAIAPFFMIAFLFFAYRGIRKDEKMLSEADRLR